MKRLFRLSIGDLAVIIMLLAVYFALIRFLVDSTLGGWLSFKRTSGFLLVTAPMFGYLFFGLFRLAVCRLRSSFLLGFETFGWSSILAYAVSFRLFNGVCWSIFEYVYEWYILGEYKIHAWVPFNDSYLLFPLASFALSLPFFCIGLFGGFLFHLCFRREKTAVRE
jgi:hypothetical protein